MPSDKIGGRGRSAIYNWRVKAGMKEVYSHPTKFSCRLFILENKNKYKQKLWLITPV
jgi:hypothetical protein